MKLIEEIQSFSVSVLFFFSFVVLLCLLIFCCCSYLCASVILTRFRFSLLQDIGEGSQTFFSLCQGPAFSTLDEFIHHYQQKPVNGVTLALRRPCPKHDRVQAANQGTAR